MVRQLYLLVLIEDYGYSTSRMELEYEVTFGREKKRADIVIFDKQDTTAPFIIVEVKKPKLKDGKEQLKSYCNATGAPIGVWSNGKSISYYHRKDPNYFEDLSSIPRADQKLSDIISERWTIDDLIKKDKLVNERKFFNAFALSGRQVGVHNHPGRRPGLGASALFRAYWVISTAQGVIIST